MTAIAAEVSIPGKLMFAGEYAVLHGGRALATTIDAAMLVRAKTTQQQPSSLLVKSDLWPSPSRIDPFSPEPPPEASREPLLDTVWRASRQFGVTNGEVEVISELCTSYGVGSSSALRLGVSVAMAYLSEQKPIDDETLWQIATLCLSWQQKQQGAASGYDIATQIAGGLQCFQRDYDHQLKSSSLRAVPGTSRLGDVLHCYVGGRGAVTATAMRPTMACLDRENRWPELIRTSNSFVEALIDYCQSSSSLGAADVDSTFALVASCSQLRRQFHGTSLVPNWLLPLEQLLGCDQTWSFKTTGAGGEDAILLVGTAEELLPAASFLCQHGWMKAPFKFSDNRLKLTPIAEVELD